MPEFPIVKKATLATLALLVVPAVTAQSQHRMSNGHICRTGSALHGAGMTLDAWRLARAQNQPFVAKHADPPEIGDERPFNVWEVD